MIISLTVQVEDEVKPQEQMKENEKIWNSENTDKRSSRWSIADNQWKIHFDNWLICRMEV